MTYKPRPWAVTSEYRVRRNAPDAFGGTRQVRAVEICWRRPPHDPSGPAEVWVVARDQQGFRRQWLVSGRRSPEDMPDWLREMVLACKPDWADTTRWPL